MATQQVVATSKDSFHIPSLDGLRAVAVMIVFLAHAGLNGIVPGNFGVTIFFFLSGYLITTLLRVEYDKSGRISLGRFYLRRILRILPPFYLVLAVASILTAVGALEGMLRFDAVLFQAGHLSNYYVIGNGWWDGRAPGTWVYWSLAVEEHFYLVFPVLYLILRRFVASRRRQMMALLGVCAAVLVWRCILVFGLQVSEDRTYIASDTRLDSILFGCLLAIWANPMLDATQVSERRWKWLWLPLGIVGLLVSFGVRMPQFQETFRYTLQGLSLIPVFVVAIRYHDWGPFRLLNIGWIKFLGLLSYTFYLVHPTIIYGVEQWTGWHPLAQAVLSLGSTLLVAVLVYHLVEKPCARLRKRLAGTEASHRAKQPKPQPSYAHEGAIEAQGRAG